MDDFVIMIKMALENDCQRVHLLVNSANAYDFSLPVEQHLYQEAVRHLCEVAPALADYDIVTAEQYDGNLEAQYDIATMPAIRSFKSWLAHNQLELRTDGDYCELFED